MNSVTLIGTLTRNPEMRNAGDTKVCAMRLAEQNARKDALLFINVSVFGAQAGSCKQYLSKGRHVAVSGQLRFREWVNDEGEKRSEYSISADRIDFLPGANKTIQTKRTPLPAATIPPTPA